MKRWQVGLWILIVVGVGVTLVDYKKWRWEETRRFGHGYEEQLEPAVPLTKVYQNDIAGVRVKYPGEWGAEENSKFNLQNSNVIVRWEEVLEEEKRELVVQWPGGVRLYIENTDKNLADIADTEVKELESEGASLAGDREYINTDEASLVILTWEEVPETGNLVVWQRAMAQKKGRLVVLEAEMAKTEWLKWKKTLEEIYRSLVII